MLEALIIVLIIISTVTAILNGSSAEAASAFLGGAERAVELVISISGLIILWSGLLKVAERSSLTQKLKRILSPVLKLFFKRASKEEDTADKISQNISANLLGLGNAATPSGIAASDKLLNGKNYREFGYFMLFNTASLQLFPITVAAVRAANGASEPFSIIFSVWTVSALSLIVGLSVFFLLSKIQGKKEKC